jgi:hypothetical protein
MLARRVAIGFAGLVAAPGVLVASAACLYIAYSIATESWYRQSFLGYGLVLAALYAVFVAGVVAAAMLATRYARLSTARARRIALVLCIAGVLAAAFLELELWDEAERVLPLGLLFGPYVGWLLAGLWLRKLPPPPPPPPQWQDTII